MLVAVDSVSRVNLDRSLTAHMPPSSAFTARVLFFQVN
jgi:hypothetical protein